jgi:hypothetical protein
MELILAVFVLSVVFGIGYMVGAKQEMNKMGTIGSKPKTQTDYQNEHIKMDKTKVIKGKIKDLKK